MTDDAVRRVAACWFAMAVGAVGAVGALASRAAAQELTPPDPKPYFDEPAWVHERPPKLTDRIWHARPAPADAKLQLVKGVRVVDFGDEQTHPGR